MALDISTMNLSESFAMNEEKAENGTWVPVTTDISVKIRRFKSQPSQRARTEFMKPYVHITRRNQELPEAIAMEVLIKQIAKAIIVDWKGVKSGDVDVPCTFDNKVEVLNALPEFRDVIVQLALDIDTFKADTDDESIKN